MMDNWGFLLLITVNGLAFVVSTETSTIPDVNKCEGTDSLFAPMRELVSAKLNSYVVQCRPTTPDVDVKLSLASNKTPDYLKFSPKIGFLLKKCGKIAYKCHGLQGKISETKNLRQPREPPKPVVIGEIEFLENETFSLNCTAKYTHNSANYLHWKYPKESLSGIVEYKNNEYAAIDGFLYNNITITNATKEHAGMYTCISENNCGEKKAKSFKIEKKYLDKPYLELRHVKESRFYLINTAQRLYSFSIEIHSYPKANLTIYRNDIEVKTEKNGSYFIEKKEPAEITHYINIGNELVVDIKKTSISTSANYTLVLTNGRLTENVTYDLRFNTEPEIKFESSDKRCIHGMKTSLECEVTGLPLPHVTWIFSSTNGTNITQESTRIDLLSIYKERAVLDMECTAIGNITCKANNNASKKGEKFQSRRLLVHEMFDGFGIDNPTDDETVWFSENQNASFKCIASKFDFTNVTWMSGDNDDLGELVTYTENEFSLIAKLNIYSISLNDSGTYKCIGSSNNGTEKNDSIFIKVAPSQKPVVILTQIKEPVERHQSIKMNCQAQGIPRPILLWKKDGENLTIPNNYKNVKITHKTVNRTTVNSSISILHVDTENFGTYDCIATSEIGHEKQTTSLILKVTEVAITKYLIVIAIIVFVCIMLVIYLTCKIKKEKRFRKELAAAGLLYFKEGVTKSINPDLGIDEQAELLPYDDKFEFPSEKLVLGKQLGAGAFGVVYRAEARGIINAEVSTTVAVKMVKKTADNMYIKALASELKIMVHLGKHINIVNLLGACTKNVGKRELVVIVEYCKFGNIHNYLQRHREVFIDQFSDDNKEKFFGKVNRGYDSTGSTGVQSDYGTANTQETDHTFLTNNTNRTCRKNVPSQPTEVAQVSEGYVQPEWRSNYESDYSYDGRSPRPLTSRDLLAWAFQIARGMEYLASRKVLHGDLAARNILLADDNVVKICDFGLARSIYKNDEYKKTENSLLPVKWLAIECMTDRIFSTQSDVWSFGIVLWELFSLAKTPYPNINPSNLLQFLSEGHRLDKPAYSDDRVYNLMKRCWEQKPTVRPSFTQLQEILGTFLEDNVRNRYVDLNQENMESNSKPEGQMDYLDMMCSPDYKIQLTPSPHHYVNEANARSFFPPTPTKIDEEGYLQMSPASIFSPKPTGTKFDFDPLNFNARPSEASSGGSELTPMLTLNNLPRSGSDSDHEGNASPYLNVCPRIEEETDEVFMTKQYNAKNALNSAVSNPTYITFDNLDVQKKPIDSNNYVNIVPNGLVK